MGANSNHSEAKFILKNKSTVLENRATKKVFVVDDKTPIQQEILKEIRKEQSRKKNGEEYITITYIQGVPKTGFANKACSSQFNDWFFLLYVLLHPNLMLFR